MSFSLAVNKMNDTAGPKGLVTSLLMLGKMPTIINFPTLHFTSFERHKGTFVVRKKFEEVVAKSIVRTTLLHKPPDANKTRF